MPILKEYRCLAHGPFEAFDAKCPSGCGSGLVKREIRTAPAHRRQNMKFIDRQMDLLAKDHGLTDLRSGDAQSGESALQRMQKKSEFKPEWIPIEHAAPGFSARGEKAPEFKPESIGFTPSPEAGATLKSLPKPTPNIVGVYRE